MSNDTKASRYDKKTKQRLATKPFSLCTTTTTRSLQTTDSHWHALTYLVIAQPHQARTAAPFTRTTSSQVFRKLFAMLVATAFALAEEHTARTLLLYAALSNDLFFARASAKSSFSKCLRNQLQNCSTGFKSGERGGTFHIFIFWLL